MKVRAGRKRRGKKTSPSVDNGDFILETHPRSGCIFASAIRASERTQRQTDGTVKQGGALIIHLTLLLTWGAWALDGGALRSVPTCFESVFMPVVNLYYKSDPHREWQRLALRGMEALRWRSGEEHTCTRKTDTHSHAHNSQRVRVKAKASVYYDILKIG